MHLYFQQIYGSKHSFLPIILRTLYFKEKPYCPLRPLRGHLSQRERQVVCANFEQADKLKFMEMLKQQKSHRPTAWGNMHQHEQTNHKTVTNGQNTGTKATR